MKISQDTINRLQSDASCIRNICILAHVDHGKTSLSDSLLASNGILSQRMAGKTRYLDSREDEQVRGITMESSAISLYFKVLTRKSGDEEAAPEIKEHLINLIDSPGHIDFSSEVSTASRLCDGALVLVDVVEGVCSQTVNVLRQCWVDKLKPILVLNKIDRLILEWKMSPLEAYQHLSRVIEQVNSVIGSFFSGERMEDDMIWRELGEKGEFIEKDDKDIYFSPELNNVLFSSAVDGWAFSIKNFAGIYLKKLGFSHSVLSKTLWGDFYLDMKNKKIIPGKKLKSNQSQLKPLFVSLILDQIWALYENCLVERNDEKLNKIIQKLDASVTDRELRSKDYKTLLNSIMCQWIPVSHAILGMVIDYLPSPIQSQLEKMDKLLNECLFNVLPEEEDKSTIVNSEFETSIKTCQGQNAEANTLAYVSKMISVPKEELPIEITTPITANEIKERNARAREAAIKASEQAAQKQKEVEEANKEEFEFALPPSNTDPFEWEYEEDYFDAEEEEDTNETLVAFTRIFSGGLERGQTITVVGPKYDPTLPNESVTNKSQVIQDVIIQDLFLIMGRELNRMDKVPAGNIVGIVGLDNIVIKNGTILSPNYDMTKPLINLSSTSTLIHNKPIMKIAVEPANLLELGKLERGLGLLSKADPVFEWYIDDDSGEIIMCVAGELHLERCIKDLNDRFAKGCDITIKEPVIPFREGLAPDELSSYEEEEEEEFDPNIDLLDIDLDVVPLPMAVVKVLVEAEGEISSLMNSKNKGSTKQEAFNSFKEKLIKGFDKEEEETQQVLHKSGFKSVPDLLDHIVSFGPKRIGPNMLVESEQNNHKFKHVFGGTPDELFDLEPNVVNGFQLAVSEGPLAAEQMQGVMVIIKKGQDKEQNEEDIDNVPILGIQGQVITHVRDFIHDVFLHKGPRLFLAKYRCEIQAATEALGKVYAVVQKRGGDILSEEMKEGTPFFTVEAKLPVIEAYGFSEEIRKRTSGAATPQLVFDGFDILEIDPFWVPHTEEELEELGEFAERENIGRRYMNGIRRRKGLFVDEKVVKNAEKQRNMKRD